MKAKPGLMAASIIASLACRVVGSVVGGPQMPADPAHRGKRHVSA